MVAILDQYGKPLKRDALTEPQTARVFGLHHEFATHPSRGLTPSKLAQILETAEQGDLLSQHDLFLDMEEKDPHIFAEMSKRKRALLGLDWDILPPPQASAQEEKATEALKELIRDMPDFEDFLFDIADGIGHGFSCLEIEWQKQGKGWLPKCFHHRPQSWFMNPQSDRNRIHLRDNSVNGAELQPFGWIQHIHRARSGYVARGGLHRVLAWPYMFKNYAVRDLAEFLEIYGLPLRLGKYPPGTGKEEKATLMQAVVGIGHDAAGSSPRV